MKKSPARNRLLETASKLFFERGYSEVGIDEIISQSNTAKATFYAHFPSKEQLVEAWLQSIHDRSLERQRDILESTDKPIDKIAHSFDSLEKYLIESNFRGCPYSNSCAVTEAENIRIREKIIAHKRNARRFYTTICQQFMACPDQAAGLADQIFLLYSGAVTETQNFREIWPVKVAKQTALLLCHKTSPNSDNLPR